MIDKNHHIEPLRYPNRKTESGNVFFIILLAIGLFAALSYTVSRDSGGNVDIFDDESAKIAAQEVIEYGNSIATVVQKLKLRGCSDTEISFEHQGVADFTNPYAPLDKSCHVFDINGGNIEWRHPPQEWIMVPPTDFMPWFNGQTAVTDVGTAEPELLMWVTQLKLPICHAINEYLGLDTSVTDLVSTHTGPFKGVYSILPDGIGDDAGSPYKGLTYACKVGDTDGAFYSVLLAR